MFTDIQTWFLTGSVTALAAIAVINFLRGFSGR